MALVCPSAMTGLAGPSQPMGAQPKPAVPITKCFSFNNFLELISAWDSVWSFYSIKYVMFLIISSNLQLPWGSVQATEYVNFQEQEYSYVLDGFVFVFPLLCCDCSLHSLLQLVLVAIVLVDIFCFLPLAIFQWLYTYLLSSNSLRWCLWNTCQSSLYSLWIMSRL